MYRKTLTIIFTLLALGFSSALLAGSCTDSTSQTTITTIGGGQKNSTNEAMTITFTGYITTQKGLTNGGRNTVSVCEGTSVNYQVNTNPGNLLHDPLLLPGLGTQADCVNRPTSGTLQPGDKLVCSNKAFGGRDTDRFRIVGVK